MTVTVPAWLAVTDIKPNAAIAAANRGANERSILPPSESCGQGFSQNGIASPSGPDAALRQSR